MRDATKFGAATSAEEALEGIDLGGKLALITGGSSGLGQETARALAAHGAHLVLTARNVPKGEGVAAAIRKSTGNQNAATAPELEGRGGLYLEDCHVAAVNDAEDALDGVKSYALDPANAARLWEVSEKLVGQKFPLT